MHGGDSACTVPAALDRLAQVMQRRAADHRELGAAGERLDDPDAVLRPALLAAHARVLAEGSDRGLGRAPESCGRALAPSCYW